MASFLTASLLTLFKLSYFGTTTFMISYWIYKFQVKDEDVSLVEFKLLEDTEYNELPIVSMCIENPFLSDELKQINPNINESLYNAYLHGELVDKKLTDIDYNNVTINVFDHLLKWGVQWRNGSVTWNITNTVNIHITFNGFYEDVFWKCFGMKANDEYYRDVKYIEVYFKRHKLLEGSMRISHNFVLYKHYPNQLLLGSLDEGAWFFKNRTKGQPAFHELIIGETQILEKRNKAKDPCMTDGKYYDDFVLKKHIKQNECQAPYHMVHKDVPVCTTKAQMTAYKYEFSKLKGKYTPHPCRRVANIAWVTNIHEAYWVDDRYSLVVQIIYPDQLKIITQSKAVDIHTFIGNIGGYIGLFLGKTYNQR